MDVINKLYSSVSNSVSQLSNVLPGNPLAREYEIDKQVCSAGIGLLWRVFKGTKKSTKQEAAIFEFQKKQLDRFSKDDKEQLLEILRRGVVQLTKIRHPHVLTVQHPLEESRDSIAFATEPVFASLANILGNHHNMPHPNSLNSYKLHDVDTKYGLIQICEGIQFLHSDVKLLHRNICPESIIVNQQGAWKIFGFDYCILNQNPHDAKPSWPFNEYNSSWHALSQPSLEYMAPECALISNHSAESDIYSLGVLIYSIYSNGGKPIKMFGKDYQSFRRHATELKQGKYPNLSSIPDGLQNEVKMMLNATPELRINLHEFTKIPFFDDIGVKTLHYLDQLFQWDNLQKSKFYKGLPQVIQKLPHRINVFRILPCLVKEFVNPPMIPFVLPNIFLISENSNSQEFVKHILCHLKPVMKITEPIQVLHLFMTKMDLLLKLTPAEDVKTDVLPMLYRALESDAQQIQELCLSILPTFASLVDYPSMKNALLPRIKKLCVTTQLVSVRVNCLLCIGKLLEHLDKWLVMDEIIPFLPQIPSREPAVLMAILGIYKLALTHSKLGLTKESLATKVIPFLVPLSIENGLSLVQFNAMMVLVKDMINRVESEHRTKLEQLSSIQKESNALKFQAQNQLVPNAKSPSKNESDDVFSNLGLEQFLNDLEEGANESTASGMSMTSSASGMSLQEKQRLTQQQEQNQRLQSQQAITPKQAPLKIANKAKDLTSSLLDNNLNQLKLTHSTSANNNSWFNTTGNSWNASTTQNNNFGSFQSPSASPASNPKESKKNDDWGAFDDLLPNAKKEKLPLNQMKSSASQPTGFVQSSKSNNSFGGMSNRKNNNELSADDIMEFLK
ncbi:CLUMA_CG002209, isoform A [Clunio marinus]|uniref:CLUMA_CG002209, isoform A n=1 Tax=Clunio marinus TaxID=568069 RepID=A0A1J1HM38_9DIPT|nr:CLUMA_CG002209, isoform A [Clunio marinus]